MNLKKLNIKEVLDDNPEMKEILLKIMITSDNIFLTGSLALCINVDVYRENGKPTDIDFRTSMYLDELTKYMQINFRDAKWVRDINFQGHRVISYELYPYVKDNTIVYKVLLDFHLDVIDNFFEYLLEGTKIKVLELDAELETKKSLNRDKDINDLIYIMDSKLD